MRALRMGRLANPAANLPPSIGAAAEAVAAAHDRAELEHVFERNTVPMVIVDDDRRYLHANAPARLAFHLSLAELRARRIDDLTPAAMLPLMETMWSRLVEAGLVTGTYEVTSPEGGSWDVVYYAVTSQRPGSHVIAFAPAGWPDDELDLSASAGLAAPDGSAQDLTARERQIVALLAHGLTGEEIAARLDLSRETIRTHIRNAMRRMGAKTRPHLVALVYDLPGSKERDA
jgi:DNA-binding CsgD family transcriptional regulator